MLCRKAVSRAQRGGSKRAAGQVLPMITPALLGLGYRLEKERTSGIDSYRVVK